MRCANRNFFGRQGHNTLEDTGKRFLNRQQRCLYASARHGPDFPPVFSSNRMPSMRMLFSAAFTMS